MGSPLGLVASSSPYLIPRQFNFFRHDDAAGEIARCAPHSSSSRLTLRELRRGAVGHRGGHDVEKATVVERLVDVSGKTGRLCGQVVRATGEA